MIRVCPAPDGGRVTNGLSGSPEAAGSEGLVATALEQPPAQRIQLVPDAADTHDAGGRSCILCTGPIEFAEEYAHTD